jgi:hypothetical protein
MKSKVLLAIAFLAIISTIGISQAKPTLEFDKISKKVVDKPLSSAAESLRVTKLPNDSGLVIEKPIPDAELDRVEKLSSEVKSLYGVKGIYVLVEELHEGAKTTGLTEKQLTTDIELKLRLAGIKVNTRKEAIASNGRPYLLVNITAVGDEYGYSYFVSLEFKQTVHLERKSKLLIVAATTWGRGRVGSRSKSQLKGGIRDSVKDKVDLFLNDYLTANPKK